MPDDGVTLVSSTAARSDDPPSSSSLATEGYVGRTRAVITAAYFGSFFSIGLVLASLGPILPALARLTGEPIEALGVLFVCRSSGYMLGSLLGGFIFDRIKRTHVPLCAGNALCALGCAVLPSLRSVPVLGAALVTQGLCMGMLDTGGNVLLIWLHGAARVEPFMQTMHFCFALGAVLSPLVIQLVLVIARSEEDFAAAFYLMAALLVLACIPLTTTHGPQPHKALDDARSDASAPTASAEAGGGGGGGASLPSSASSKARRVCGLPPLQAWLVALSSLCVCVYVGSEVGFGGFIFTYATTHLDVADEPARILNSAYWGGLAAGRLLAIPAAARLRPHTILYASLLGTLVAASALLAVRSPSTAADDAPTAPPAELLTNLTNPTELTELVNGTSDGAGAITTNAIVAATGAGSPLAWLATLAMGLCHAPVFPTALTHLERYMSVSGKVASTFCVSAAVGEALLPLIIAYGYSSWGGTSFPVIILGASGAQLAAFVGARRAARAMSARPRSEQPCAMAAAPAGEREGGAIPQESSGTASSQEQKACSKG